ncbi:PIN domain-containing protein [Peribacillus butanolivorans]|uniref:type II toxin-antitoxin system VapC family toxin n=1 Tax=Peribacillus butanolivorans TaxID=421767 RepID=UPI0030C9506A
MAKVIFDTNFYTDLLSGYPKVVETFTKHIIENDSILMPTIIMHEVLSNSKYETEPATQQAVDGYIRLAKDNITGLTEEIAKKAAEIRRHYRIQHNNKLKAPDAIIAATAMLHDATLISNNYSDFKHAINDLELNFYNPIDDQEDLQQYRESLKK